MCFGLQMILNLLGMKCVIAMVFLGVSGYYIFSDSDPFASLTYKNFFFLTYAMLSLHNLIISGYFNTS